MVDKSGWGQVLVGILTVGLAIGAGWLALSNNQAGAMVKIVQLEDDVQKSIDYDTYLQEQIDKNKERIIITETTIKYLKENFGELNDNMKVLVSEVQELNKNMAVQMDRENKQIRSIPNASQRSD